MTLPTLTIKDHNMTNAEIRLNGELLKLKSYSIERDAQSFAKIQLELGYHDVELEHDIQSDDVVLLKWRGMTFKRIDVGDVI